MTATAQAYNRLHNSSIGCAASGGSSGHTQLARSLERILEEAHLSGELILTNRKLKDFPKTTTKYELNDTVIADLSRNRFCELPEEITTFAFLETLLLYHNTIRNIPESVKQLTSLTYLDLRSNQLVLLPREICFLPLQVLLISNNRLTALPDELGRMERLTDLDASYNQLSALPARIGELRSLRSFSLRSNQLVYLPRELTCLSLVVLDVSNNRIGNLPLEFRQMTTLVEFNLENNPLTSPPASLCVRGLVHVFKYLETQATKDEKGTRAGGNYDGYTTLRRAPRHNSAGNMLETVTAQCGQRSIPLTGYASSEIIDKRWSHDGPGGIKSPNHESSPILKPVPTVAPMHSLLSVDMMDASLTSSTSTIVDESLSSPLPFAVKNLNIPEFPKASPSKQQQQQQQEHTTHAHSNGSSNCSSPNTPEEFTQDLVAHQSNQLNGLYSAGKANDEKPSKSLNNIQTYKEYKEALKQQRNQDINSVYKQKTVHSSNNINDVVNEELRAFNGGVKTAITVPPKSIMKHPGTTKSSQNGLPALNGSTTSISGDDALIPKKPIQKVIPSRNTELMLSKLIAKNSDSNAEGPQPLTNGDCLDYVKPNSPLKSLNCLNTNGAETNKLDNNVSFIKSPLNGATKLGTLKINRSVTWNQDIPTDKLSFTMRREFDRQREETELMTQLRSIIETRLKMTLPEDIASALTDGVILCHLANYVRPRSVASIHVPSPGVAKLTMARCRRNVDNFLEACRRIGVDENLICCAADVLEGKGAVQVAITVCELIRLHGQQQTNVTNVNSTTTKASTAQRTAISPSPLV